MSRRPAPRPAAEALRAALHRVAPRTSLAAVQSVWANLAGEQVAAQARPVSERDGVVTIVCSDPVWAEELDLMQGQLLERLRGSLGDDAPSALRFRVEDDRD
jgi:predicted nucleic acid-binding Zn ribbon protein